MKERFFAIKEGSQYMDIDNTSGHPYKTDINHCKRFTFKQEACKYIDKLISDNGAIRFFQNFKIVECEYIIREL